MNFLAICQRVRQEAGISGSGPTTVSGQTGEMGKIVDWVASAYQDVQDQYPTWNFLRFDFSWPTIAASATYLPSAVSLSELGQWRNESVRAYLTATGVADECRLRWLEWDRFRDLRLMGVVPSGKPVEFSIRPDKSMVLWPTPDAIYTVVGEYWKRAQAMTVNADEPLIPAQFHMVLVWKAVMYYAQDQGAAELYGVAEKEFLRLLSRLKRDQLQRISLAGGLA